MPATVPPLTSRTGLVRAYAFTPGEPPAEVQLWRAGDNPTDYGVHLWTARSAQLVADDYAERGNPLQVDVEHNAAAGEPAPTGGYARLELRTDRGGVPVPWLVFDWSAYAIDQIRTRQRLFMSPEYLVDKGTNEIVKLIRVSLVGAPGTHHAKQLASASLRIAASSQKEIQMDPKQVTEALDALIAGDAEKAMAILKAMIAQAAGGAAPSDGDEPPGPEAAAAPPPPPPSGAGGAPPAPPPKKDDKMQAAAASVAASAAPPMPKPVAAANPLEQRIDAIERDQLIKDNAKRFPNDSIRAWAAQQPLGVVKTFVASLPAATAPTKAAAPTRGAGQGAADASHLPPEEKAALDERMGLGASHALIERKGTNQIFRAMTREQAAQHVAAKAKAQAAGKEGAK